MTGATDSQHAQTYLTLPIPIFAAPKSRSSTMPTRFPIWTSRVPLGVKRETVEAGLDLMLRVGLVEVTATADGVQFQAGDEAAADELALTIEIVKRSDTKGFVVLPRRWVVEWTLAWISRRRRLVRDYERLPEHHEALVTWSMIILMSRRLARTRQ